MDYKNINKIINKYFEAETSLQEENLLKEYFMSDNIVSEHIQYKPLFLFYEEEAKQLIPTPIQIDRFRKKRNYKLATAAVLILGIGFFSILFKEQTLHKNQLANKESKKEIYKEVKKYSSDLNKGIRQISAFGFIGKSSQNEKQNKDTISKNKK